MRPHANLAALHQSITKKWYQLLPAYIRLTCRLFRSHLEAVMAKNGA
jgi:hypothetical protein